MQKLHRLSLLPGFFFAIPSSPSAFSLYIDIGFYQISREKWLSSILVIEIVSENQIFAGKDESDGPKNKDKREYRYRWIIDR